MLIALSNRGYIKRMPCDTYQAHTGAAKGSKDGQGDALRQTLVADTHDNLLFFTDRGKVYQLKAYEVPEATRQAKGLPVVNLISWTQERS